MQPNRSSEDPQTWGSFYPLPNTPQATIPELPLDFLELIRDGQPKWSQLDNHRDVCPFMRIFIFEVYSWDIQLFQTFTLLWLLTCALPRYSSDHT
jgi:hypothetical protein